jgi:nitroreductase
MAVLHRVPVLLVPCIYGHTDRAPIVEQAGTWGSILPTTWSFMLAARSRGLGTTWLTPPALFDPEALGLLALPETFMPAALIPVAHTVGTDFKQAARVPLDEVVQWL